MRRSHGVMVKTPRVIYNPDIKMDDMDRNEDAKNQPLRELVAISFR